jgi:hypothetical protein
MALTGIRTPDRPARSPVAIQTALIGVTDTLPLTSALDVVCGQRHAPAAYPGKDQVPIVYKAGWAPGPFWTGAEKLAPPPGFDPRTIHPSASRYID